MKSVAREVTTTAALSASIALLPAVAELLGLGSYEFVLLILAVASAVFAVVAVLTAAFSGLIQLNLGDRCGIGSGKSARWFLPRNY